MGGRVWATAQTGAGAEFGFSLPLYDEADAPEPDLAAPMRPRPVEAVEPAIAAATTLEPDAAEAAAERASGPWLDGPSAAPTASPA